MRAYPGGGGWRPMQLCRCLSHHMKRFETVYVELEPGDAMIFDGNLIHGSGPNRSNTQLWSYISYYNAVGNGHYKETHEYGHYEPLEKVSAASILLASNPAG
ncbi:phytanoyl-CoA dioxygenase family protein [Bradyrhizobium retamae]|uniref:phytanoyl-CoA dioxygenase family protein n=1 Tax=Bradyrhizobium retamae TaxID=1300035 RepID=UPI003D3216B0